MLPGVVLLALVAAGSGCVTQGDFLRLKERVAEYHQARGDEPDPFERIAELSAAVDSLRKEISTLRGELELARRESSEALEQVRLTRTALAQGQRLSDEPSDEEIGAAADDGESTESAAGGGSSGAAAPAPDQELAGYQEALDAWRSESFDACIDRFTVFLQSYPTSSYADDAAYWLADCTFKNADYKRAVVRFNAVVSVYPDSPKAPDALYRQGESLLRLGPKFHEAARTVFKRVQQDYPRSERAAEAAQQLERLGSGGDARG